MHNKWPYLSLTIFFFYCLVYCVTVLHCCYDHFPSWSLKCRLLSFLGRVSSILHSENNPDSQAGNFFLFATETNRTWAKSLDSNCCSGAPLLLLAAFFYQVTLQPRRIRSLSSYPLVPNPCPLPLSLTLQPGFKHCESGLSSPALHRWTAPVMGHDWPQ